MASTSVPDLTATRRSKAKSDRRSQLIAAAERLVAERGYLAVRLEDIGAAAGVSGPAIYRHFPNKEALLVELLVGISTRLLAGATDVVTRADDARSALDGLVDFHLDFALGESDLIRIQDRDLPNLPPGAKRQVRKAQRQYVEIWVDVLRQLNTSLQRGRCSADGARRVRIAEFDTTFGETKCDEKGRGQRACRPSSDDGCCADLGRWDRERLVPGSAAADGASDGPEDPEDGADNYQHDTDRRQDADAEDVAEHGEDDSKDNHRDSISIELSTASGLLTGLRDIAVRHLRIDSRVVQRADDDRERDTPRRRAIGCASLKVTALIGRKNADQQPDEH